jgi:2-amino-4-hydroxy-6-hydroxymethyldihydropteridine diphosphokinase
MAHAATTRPGQKVYLSLGANLGDRLAFLLAALHALDTGRAMQIQAISSVYETEPVGKSDQANFYNLVVGVLTDLDPIQLLKKTQEIETSLGRVRHERWGARTIDIDILCMEGVPFWQDELLSLPHPRLTERRFVLIPFAEIAPTYSIPGMSQTIIELLSACPDTHDVRLCLKATNLQQRMREANA